MNLRKLTPEILDELPPDDPAAIRSRRDLALVNQVMGNYRWLSATMNDGGSWLELGAGSGSLATCFKDSSQLRVTGVDFAPRPPNWPGNWRWHQGDLFAFLAEPEGDPTGIAANLFLHHFTDEQLGRIGALIPPSVNRLVFSEPARYLIHQIQGTLGFPLFNHVTRHDMIVSIEAGFRDDELALALRLDRGNWEWKQSRTFFGSYRFEAWRIK